jgi:hypothetical protein
MLKRSRISGPYIPYCLFQTKGRYVQSLVQIGSEIWICIRCIHTYIHAYIHTCIHTYVRTYIHTYKQTFIFIYKIIRNAMRASTVFCDVTSHVRRTLLPASSKSLLPCRWKKILFSKLSHFVLHQKFIDFSAEAAVVAILVSPTTKTRPSDCEICSWDRRHKFKFGKICRNVLSVFALTAC